MYICTYQEDVVAEAVTGQTRLQIAPAVQHFKQNGPKEKKPPFSKPQAVTASTEQTQVSGLKESKIGDVLWDRGVKLAPKNFDHLLSVVRVVADDYYLIKSPKQLKMETTPATEAETLSQNKNTTTGTDITDINTDPAVRGADRLFWGIVPASAYYTMPSNLEKIADGGVAKAEAKLTEVISAVGINVNG